MGQGSCETGEHPCTVHVFVSKGITNSCRHVDASQKTRGCDIEGVSPIGWRADGIPSYLCPCQDSMARYSNVPHVFRVIFCFLVLLRMYFNSASVHKIYCLLLNPVFCTMSVAEAGSSSSRAKPLTRLTREGSTLLTGRSLPLCLLSLVSCCDHHQIFPSQSPVTQPGLRKRSCWTLCVPCPATKTLLTRSSAPGLPAIASPRVRIFRLVHLHP